MKTKTCEAWCDSITGWQANLLSTHDCLYQASALNSGQRSQRKEPMK